ncbi:MAG: hypothetical protein ACK4VM_10280 [Bosea sp. (in: a-proteobacteria)]
MRRFIFSAAMIIGAAFASPQASVAAPVAAASGLEAPVTDVIPAQYRDWRDDGRAMMRQRRYGPPPHARAYGRRYGGPPPHARAYGRRGYDRPGYRW